MGEDDNLDFTMDMFDDNFEIFMDDVDPTDDEDVEEQEHQEDTEGDDIEEDNLSEDDNPEGVAEEEDEGDEESDVNDDESSPNVYNSLAGVLFEQGLLPSFKDKLDSIKTIDDLTKAFKEEIKSNEFTDLSADQKEFLESIRDGVSQEHFLKYKENEQILNSITEDAVEEDVDLRKNLIYQDFINTGLTQERAIRLTEASIKSGSDVEDAIEALKNLKLYEKQKFEIEKQSRVEEKKKVADLNIKRDETIKKTIKEKKDLFKGLDIPDGVRETTLKTMTTVVGIDEKGKPENKLIKYRRENPEEFDAKLYLLFEMTNGFSDLSKIKASSSSKAIRELEDNIRKSNFIEKGGQPDFLKKSDQYFRFGDELVL